MRLNAYRTELVVNSACRHFGEALFGSRLDDTARCGAVDPLVDTPDKPTLQQSALATMDLEGALRLPMKILAVKAGEEGSAFMHAVRPPALPLEASA